ncbi:MAG: TPM domain-containing protein, partial [Hymenobacter sp.]
MYRFVAIALLFVGVGLGQPAAAQTAADLPARPVPFTFVTDQGKLLSAADAKKLDGGLRSYAEKTGTQVVVVTVPSLGGRSVADYGRALGTAWGVGQRDKNNGVVVLLSAQEHKVTIQPGSGLASVITPAVTSRIIGEMTPAFKQGNYFTGLRSGLNTLLVTANPSSNPNKGTAGAASTAATAPVTTSSNLSDNSAAPVANDPVGTQQSEVSAPASSGGIGMGTLLIGALVIGGILFFIIKMFRNRSAAQSGNSPNFYPNQGGGNRPNQNPNQPNFYPNQGGNQGPGNFGGGYNNQGNNSG